MSRRPLGIYPCFAGCGTLMRRSDGKAICRADMALAERFFRSLYPYRDPDSHVRQRNLFFGNRQAVVAAIQAERLAVAV